MQRLKTAVFAVPLLILTASHGWASPAVGLAGDRTLVMFDTKRPAITRRVDVSGVEKLVGIDWSSADGTLKGVTREGGIVAIDTKTGKATELHKMDRIVPTGETPVVVDINPATGSLRLMTGTTNHRVDREGTVTVDSQLAYLGSDTNAATLPSIVAAAYTNSYGTPTTTLYGIDAGTGALVRQTMPNDGALKTIGNLGIGEADSYAFDIETAADGTNTAWLAAGTSLYRVDLETGKATKSGNLTGLEERLRDFSLIGSETKSAM